MSQSGSASAGCVNVRRGTLASASLILEGEIDTDRVALARVSPAALLERGHHRGRFAVNRDVANVLVEDGSWASLPLPGWAGRPPPDPLPEPADPPPDPPVAPVMVPALPVEDEPPADETDPPVPVVESPEPPAPALELPRACRCSRTRRLHSLRVPATSKSAMTLSSWVLLPLTDAANPPRGSQNRQRGASSRSMTRRNFPMGCAPETNTPLITNDGVPLIPAASATAASASTTGESR